MVENRYKYDPNEPANSYEVCYVLIQAKRGYFVQEKWSKIMKSVSWNRKQKLDQWMEYGYNYRWLVDHL